MNIKVMIPMWLDAEEFVERYTKTGIKFRKGKCDGQWCIYVPDQRSKCVALLILAKMGKELNEEMQWELENWKE